MFVSAETIGKEYLNKLCVYIYKTWGISVFDYSKDKNDIETLLNYINEGEIELTHDLSTDAFNILCVMEPPHVEV